MKIDKNGYKRGKIKHSDLIHRQIAYEYIYLKHREEYPLPFSKYEVHHKDMNKLNNDVSNLQIVTPKQHSKIHKNMIFLKPETYKNKIKIYNRIDVLGIFIKDFTEEDISGYIFKSEFINHFNTWCEENNFKKYKLVYHSPYIEKKMKERGYTSERISNLKRAWSGLKWKRA